MAILASIAIAAINPAEQFKKSQDSKRKSDLAQIQRAIELYYQDFGRYPLASQNKICKLASADWLTCQTVADWGQAFLPYINLLPIDSVGNKNYAYWADATGQSYAIYASLDRGAKDSQVCNNGAACTNAVVNSITCGNVICDYGVSSPNIAP